MEYSILEILLISTSLSIGCLWILAAAFARNEYEKRSYKNGKLIRELPSISYFLLRGMAALYKLQINPEIEFKQE
tara:strand:- start:540 stop:764 length:225 start_codon:yes stop_codon:yes gene_type:complete